MDKGSVLDELRKVVVMDTNGQLPQCLKVKEKGQRSSMLCISALLGHLICKEVIDAPFRPLRRLLLEDEAELQESPHLDTPYDSVISGIYRKLIGCKYYSVFI